MSKARKRREGSSFFFFFLSPHCFQLNWQEMGVLYLSLWGAKLIWFHFSDVSATTRNWGHFRSPPKDCVLHLHNWHLSKLKRNHTSMGSFGLDGCRKLPPSISDLFYFLISPLIKWLLGLWTLTDACLCVCVCVCVCAYREWHRH